MTFKNTDQMNRNLLMRMESSWLERSNSFPVTMSNFVVDERDIDSRIKVDEMNSEQSNPNASLLRRDGFSSSLLGSSGYDHRKIE